LRAFDCGADVVVAGKMGRINSPRLEEIPTGTFTFQNSLTATSSNSFRNATSSKLRQPWRHSVAQDDIYSSSTVREFKPNAQRWRLLAACLWQWLLTAILCSLLAMTLALFAHLKYMTVGYVKGFNAIIVLLSLLLGNNLTSSLREYALMLRWRILASKYRSLREFDIILRCESLRKVLKLFWQSNYSWINETRILCVVWLSINLILQVLVALLGLTYALETASVPASQFGMVSIADLSIIRDVWAAEHPTFFSQLGSAQSFGIQGQDYLFVNDTPPGQGRDLAWGNPGMPTVYANSDWTVSHFQHRLGS
jgi:hypothetical protein